MGTVGLVQRQPARRRDPGDHEIQGHLVPGADPDDERDLAALGRGLGRQLQFDLGLLAGSPA
jgi:hypothetical protein